MKILYLGHSCFQLTAKDGTCVVTDPYTKVGYELPSGLWADIVTVSHGHFDHNYTQAVQNGVVIAKAGEYCFNGIKITGVDSWHDEKQGALRGGNTIFKIKMDGITVCHLGDLGEPCRAELLRAIGDVDVLLVPVGGTYTVDAVGAKAYADGICPKKLIPMHYKPTDGKLDITSAEPFLALYNEEEIQRVLSGEIVIEQTDLENGEKIIYLERAKS
ncbi:MAG: MBL fold metallo-hydrolase [Clostridia bacterium]|nr:MBL fold metallo-hydrolase [Clostridia bacterium]